MERSTIGRYEIISELGRGGMAQVYLAYDPLFDRRVALKVIKSLFSDNELFRTRFRREARTIARLEHRAIVPVYDTGTDNDQLYLVMRYMPGDTLRKQLDQDPIIPLHRAIFTLNRIAAALESAHRQGVVHRDIKPANVLLDDEGATFLADFGIAHVDIESEIMRGTKSLAETLHYIGSPYYMAPEQWTKGSSLGPFTDVYQLGVMMFEMLTGKRPFPENSLAVLKLHHIETTPPLATTVNATLPPICDMVLAKAMAKDPQERYQTPKAMAEELAQALNPERIKNRYELTNELARGHLSTIYLAHDMYEEEDIVLRRVKYQLLPNQMMRQRFQNLAQTLSNYKHPVVLPVLDMGEDQRKPYVTMPFINGPILTSRLRRDGFLPVVDVCDIAQRLALALDDVHSHQLVHGDIRPSKLLLDENGECFLTALGLSQVADLTEAVLQDDFISSAAAYMAPEQWRGASATPRTDIYQFGVTLFELLTGQRPFNGPTQADYQIQHQQNPPPSVTKTQPELPVQFDEILAKAMAKDPVARYLTATELADALHTAHTQYVVASIIAEAQLFYEMRSWDEAIDAYEDVLKIQPDNADARTFSRLAKEHQAKTAVYKRGQQAIDDGRWQDAIHYLEQIPGYEDSDALLATARKQNLLDAEYQRGVQAYQKRDWLLARASFYQADQIQPNYKELGSLLPAVEREIEQVLQQAQIALNEGQWQSAIKLLIPLTGDNQAEALRQQAVQEMENGRQSTKSSRKWIVAIGGILLFFILLMIVFNPNNGSLFATLFTQPTATPIDTPLSDAEAEQCLRTMEIAIKNSQNSTIFLGKEAISLQNTPTTLTAITDFQPECATLMDSLCLTWESASGDVDSSTCTDEINYTPSSGNDDFIVLTADISSDYPNSDVAWDIVIPIEFMKGQN